MRTYPSFKGYFFLDERNELLASSGEMIVCSGEFNILCLEKYS